MKAGPLLLSLVLAAGHAMAVGGRPCDDRSPSTASVVQGIMLAERTAAALDATGAEVVAIARAGQDLSRYGLTYSHLGWAYRDGVGAPWRVVHKLNGCGTARAAVYRQGLAEFFLDAPHDYRAGVVIPRADLQQRLLPLLRDNARVAALHTPAYSMVAYPWAQRYQQSNQWAIETLALAAEPGVSDRQQAQAWLQAQAYEPTVLRLGPLTRLGARVSQAHVAFDDHPDAKRYADRIETVTVDSVFRWLTDAGLADSVREIR